MRNVSECDSPALSWRDRQRLSNRLWIGISPPRLSASDEMPSTEKNRESMMKNARKVPEHTVFFMDNGSLYYTPGRLDPTGHFDVN